MFKFIKEKIIKQVEKIRNRQKSSFCQDLILKSFMIGGKDKTINHLFEEMGELITAICQNNRKRNSIEDIKSEMADVIILLAKVELIYGNIDRHIELKLNKLKNRLEHK